MASIRARRLALALGITAGILAGGGVAYALGPGARPAAHQAEGDVIGPWTEPSASESASPSPSETSPSPSETSPSPAASTSAPPKTASGCQTGEKQSEVEQYLAQLGGYGPITVDGVQTAEDCATIRKFQTRFGISPANGRAGPTTADVARRIATSYTAAELAKCGAGPELTACVDLTMQTVWVVRGGQLILGPTVTRTGKRGYATPAGVYHVKYRELKAWSVPYKVWLPYWQNFVNGIGFHETPTYIHNMPIGSHGCVNLLRADAKSLWNTIEVGTTVRVFGRRPGT